MDELDLSEWTVLELQIAQEDMHVELAHELHLAGSEILYALELASIAFLFPIHLINKLVYLRLRKRKFILSSADIIDVTIFALVALWLEVFAIYSSTGLELPLFGEEEDNQQEIKVMRNIIYHIEDDSFHTDYLLAAITALFWFRCIMLLRLSETFGPLIEMIYAMVVLFVQFMTLFMLELITFSCIAALTITDHPKFSNLWQALRTYLEASLGHFDLHQYDDYIGFKRWFGMFLHILVLFVNMILIINLLIAIMSDTYARMSDLRIGLYWSTVIKEMPKYTYHRTYGILVMMPFVFSWIGLLAMPVLCCMKNRQKLARINEISFRICFGLLSIVVILTFIAVNIFLVPFAYVKTLVHKIMLYRHYRGSSQLRNVFIFALFGLIFLVGSQFKDLYFFMRHMYKSKQ